MPKEIKITCNNCDKDISHSIDTPAWRIALTNEPIPIVSSSVKAISVQPHLAQDAYFCCWRCLTDWIEHR